MRVSYLGGRNCEVLACIWFGLVMCVWVMYLVCFCNAFVRMCISHLSVHIFGCTPFYSSCEHLLNSRAGKCSATTQQLQSHKDNEPSASTFLLESLTRECMIFYGMARKS